MRVVYFIAGVCLALIGLVGLALPVIPQMPFFFLALLCFMRVSERFRRWVKGLWIYKRFLKRFEEIPKRQKIVLGIVGVFVFTVVLSIVGGILYYLTNNDFFELFLIG